MLFTLALIETRQRNLCWTHFKIPRRLRRIPPGLTEAQLGWDGWATGGIHWRSHRSSDADDADITTGWWFWTFGLFFHIVGMSSSQLTFIFFRWVGQPPTRGCIMRYSIFTHRNISYCWSNLPVKNPRWKFASQIPMKLWISTSIFFKTTFRDAKIDRSYLLVIYIYVYIYNT